MTPERRLLVEVPAFAVPAGVVLWLWWTARVSDTTWLVIAVCLFAAGGGVSLALTEWDRWQARRMRRVAAEEASEQ